MRTEDFAPDTEVVVGNILRLPAFNRLALENWKQGQPQLRFFTSAELLRRRLGAHGTIVGGAESPADAGVFVVRHHDGTTALYHASELVTAATFAAQLSEHGLVPLKRAVGMARVPMEIYEGIDPASIICDHLVVPLPDGTAHGAWPNLALHQSVGKLHGGIHRRRLSDAAPLAANDTLVARATGESYKAVIFINGIRPTMDAIDKTLRAAAQQRSRSVVLPYRYFEFFNALEDDARYDDLLHQLDIMAEVAEMTPSTTIRIAL